MAIKITGPISGGAGGATTLGGLTDVTISSVQNDQIIKYNSTSGDWENSSLNVTGGLIYKGSLDASQAATPDISNAEQGDFYIISVAGTIYGQSWNVGDHLLINEDMGGSVTNSKIDKIDNTDAVASVNGQTGVVVLDTDDVAEGAANEYFTDAKADARADVRIAASDLNALNDVSYTAGPGIDNYVLTYDNTAGTWGAEVAASAPVDSVNGQTGVVVLDTDDVAEGAANEYFTDAKADARADVRIAAADLTDLNDVSYTAGPGIDNYVLTYDNTSGTWGAEVAATAPVDSVNGQTGVVVLDTDDVAEGAANEYFTDAKADARIAAADLNDLNDVSYTAGPGIDNYVLTYDNTAGTWGAEVAATAPVDSVNGQTGVVVLDTDDVAEGAANEYFTDAKADARADVRIAASDLNALNDVSYTAGPGIDNYVLTYDNTAGTWGAEVAASAPVSSVNGQTGVVVLDTDDVAEGAANEYFTDAKADARADVRIAAADLTDLNDVSYTAGPGIDNYVLTYDNTAGTWGAEAASSGPRPTVTTDSSAANATITDPAGSVLEDIYLVNNSSTAVTITLPTVTGNAGYKVQVKRLGTADVTISPASGTIDGAASQVLSVQYAALTLTTDGTNWFII